MTPAAQQAMQMLAERSGLDPGDLAGMGEDPMALLLLAAAQRTQESSAGDEVDALERRALAAEAQWEEANRALLSCRSAVASSRALARYVARVFGSCERCCGLNALCPTCGGQGTPGSQAPDREELLRWLQPALARTGLVVVPAPEETHLQGGPIP